MRAKFSPQQNKAISACFYNNSISYNYRATFIGFRQSNICHIGLRVSSGQNLVSGAVSSRGMSFESYLTNTCGDSLGCEVEAVALNRLLIQRRPTDFGVSCVILYPQAIKGFPPICCVQPNEYIHTPHVKT
jgi:hypothetical protein